MKKKEIRQFTLRLPKDLFNKIKKVAQKESRTTTSQIIYTLKKEYK